MALFFEVVQRDRLPSAHARLVIREVCASSVPSEDLDAAVDRYASMLADSSSTQIKPRVQSFVLAVLFVLVLGALATWAENSGLKVAPEELWKAFQILIGVIVGFLGGEAAGIASTDK